MVPTTNYTQFAIKSASSRYCWATFHIIVFLSSLIGDSLILYGTLQRNVFKLNPIIVTVIQHIAVSDLTYAIFSVLPSAISLLADAWILGEVLCYLRAYLVYFVYTAALYLIALMTTSKFLLLKIPIKFSNWSKKKGHMLCCTTLIPAALSPILFLVLDKSDVGFDYKTYTCDYRFTADAWESLRPLITILNLFAPTIIIVATTVPTLKYLADARQTAKRVRGSVPWQGAVTVALTAVVCCVSILPSVFLNVGGNLLKNTGDLKLQFARVAKFLLSLNIMSNFYIYTLTVKSFQRFLLSKVQPLTSLSWQDSDLRTSTGDGNIRQNNSV